MKAEQWMRKFTSEVMSRVRGGHGLFEYCRYLVRSVSPACASVGVLTRQDHALCQFVLPYVLCQVVELGTDGDRQFIVVRCKAFLDCLTAVKTEIHNVLEDNLLSPPSARTPSIDTTADASTSQILVRIP